MSAFATGYSFMFHRTCVSMSVCVWKLVFFSFVELFPISIIIIAILREKSSSATVPFLEGNHSSLHYIFSLLPWKKGEEKSIFCGSDRYMETMNAQHVVGSGTYLRMYKKSSCVVVGGLALFSFFLELNCNTVLFVCTKYILIYVHAIYMCRQSLYEFIYVCFFPLRENEKKGDEARNKLVASLEVQMCP